MKFRYTIQIPFLLLSIVVSSVVLMQPALAQSTSGLTEHYPQPPAQSTICAIADGKQAAVVTNGQCSAEYLTGICSSIIDFAADALFGYTWNNGACTVQVEGVSGLIKLNNQSKTGVLAGIQKAQAFLLDQRPVSAKAFVEEKIFAIQNLGRVNAQEENPLLYYPGTGFSLLQPIQSFWGWSVNIVYGLLILIIIGVALSIVFRSSLNGNAIVTIQNAIPNIALAMILVPLSYAISGLFIDAVTIGTNVVHQFLVGPGAPGYDVYLNRNEDLGDRREGTSAYESGFYDRGLYADDDRVNWVNARNGLEIETEVNGFITFVSNIAADNGFQLVSGLASVFGYGADRNGWIGSVVNFVVSIILLLTGLRIFWKLLQKWLVIIIGPILAPFVFATVAVPGNGTKAIMNFIKFMGSFSATYIVAYAMLLLSIVLSSRAFQASIPDFGSSGYIPPLMGIDQFLGAGAGNLATIDTNLTGFYLALASLVVYLLIPKTLDNVNKQLGGDVNPIAAIIGDAIGSAKDSINLGKQGVNLAWNAPKKVNSARVKAVQTTLNALDRARGLKPGEAGSYLARRRDRLTSKQAELAQKRQEAIESGNWGAARYYQTRLNQVERNISDQDSATGGDGKKAEGPNQIQLKITWGATEGAFEYNNAEREKIEQTSPDQGTGYKMYATGGRLVAPNNFVTSGKEKIIKGGKLLLISKTTFFPRQNRPESFVRGARSSDRAAKPSDVVNATRIPFLPFNQLNFKGYKYVDDPAAEGRIIQYANNSGGKGYGEAIFGQKGVFGVFIELPGGISGAEIQPDGKTAALSLAMIIYNVERFKELVSSGALFKSKWPEEIKAVIDAGALGYGGVGLESNRTGFGVRFGLQGTYSYNNISKATNQRFTNAKT